MFVENFSVPEMESDTTLFKQLLMVAMDYNNSVLKKR